MVFIVITFAKINASRYYELYFESVGAYHVFRGTINFRLNPRFNRGTGIDFMSKTFILYNFFIFVAAFIGCVAIWHYHPFDGHIHSFLSPVPPFLTEQANGQVTSLDLWIPQISTSSALSTSPLPQITAESALSYDLTSNKFLFQKNINERLAMASLTKIMTAIIALEHPLAQDKYKVIQGDLVGENEMGLSSGEVLSLQELLYGLVLPSGNDAAQTLATNFPGGVSGFVDAMNAKAKSLGLSDTHFSNPSGLEGDGDQHTTAFDLLVITHYALTHFPIFAEIVSTPEIDISQTSTHKEYYLFNETNLLTTYPGVKGVKDGYTPEAGLCLITYLDYEGHQILAVLLGSADRRGEMKEILDYSLESLDIKPPNHE